LELSAAEELTALEYLEILQKNGFEVSQSSTSIQRESSERGRISLVAMPVSKSTTFNIKGRFSTISRAGVLMLIAFKISKN
jgi:hypothetical protein